MTTAEKRQITSEDLRAALASVETAQKRYRKCREAEQEARRESTNAVNAVNEATKTFDAMLAEFKAASPSDTDWTRRPGVPA